MATASQSAQEFAWPEEDLPKRKAERGSSLSAERAVELAKEPMFCFEVRLIGRHRESMRAGTSHALAYAISQGVQRTIVMVGTQATQ